MNGGGSELYARPPRAMMERGAVDDDLDDFTDDETPMTEPIYSGR